MLICASLALPFHSRQCSRSTSSTITALAATRAGSSADRPLAVCLRCWRRIPMWNQSRIGRSLMPASARMRRSPEHPSVKAVSTVSSVRPTVSRLRPISASRSVSALATAPKTCRPPVSVSTLPTRTSRCRSPSSQLRMNVEVQAHRNRRHRRFRLGHGSIIPKRLADFQGMTAQGFRVLRGIDRKHLLQHVSGHPVRHQGREMRLKLVQFRGRAAVRGPSDASLDRATPSTAKTRKPNHDLAKMRRDRMVPVILYVTNATTTSALRPPNRVAPGLRGNDLLLEACQHPLSVGHGQPQIGDIVKIIRPVDLDDVGERLFTVSSDFHQSYDPSHASTPGQIKRRKYRFGPPTPKLAAVPAEPCHPADKLQISPCAYAPRTR